MTLDEFCRAKALIATHSDKIKSTIRTLEDCEFAIRKLGGDTTLIATAISNLKDAVFLYANETKF